MKNNQTVLTGWGRYPKTLATIIRPKTISEFIPRAVKNIIARGAGRSYGDAATNDNGEVSISTELNKTISFDEENGVLTCQAGKVISDLLAEITPKGWILPVMPGTKFATIGGCVAADVHGKNQHKDGSFGHHILSFKLSTPLKEVEVFPTDTLFLATLGGMGLTGFITEVTLRLHRIPSNVMHCENIITKNIEDTIHKLSSPEYDDVYTVAWIDSSKKGKQLGRGILMRGHHADAGEMWYSLVEKEDKPRRVFNMPVDIPTQFLNRLSIRLFNGLYYYLEGRRGQYFCNYDNYFFPLDALIDWNKLYGKHGFIQYQFVLPNETAAKGMREILEKIVADGHGSFLTVLKRFAYGGSGYLSFPTPGFTLAIDMRIGSDPTPVLKTLDDLDKMVIHYGGRIYLAKDARLSKEAFEKMYPQANVKCFLEEKTLIDPTGIISSTMGRRIGLCAA